MGWFKRLIGKTEPAAKAKQDPSVLSSTWLPTTPPAPPRAAHPAAQPPRHRRPAPPVRKSGVVYRSDYLSPADEARLFALDTDGMPTGYLRRGKDRLLITPDSEPEAMVNPKSTRVYRLGLFAFQVRGTSHHEDAVKSARLRRGQAVRLAREPHNAFDSNAVAVYAANGAEPLGYVNKLNAKRLAKVMDAGSDIAGICLRAGDTVPLVLAARPDVLAHLSRRL